jgi:hypothetical protein
LILRWHPAGGDIGSFPSWFVQPTMDCLTVCIEPPAGEL